ncbi:hypothetical protein HZ500_000888 [Salmonella enterica]|uniref:hypothetical protein n=1 Tax=Salmonella enterica TaxID=28901 RepID=UPI001F0D8285|nr:hypothetical protein [Salmonella enterica subsp. diarizonae]EIF7173137.1 hypothetical protein [Salmonella enterica]EIF8862524.1 hypothetical protein [Salmonella enterica]MCH5482538.1 hypothetical protein [Salmonella enterica subsp. diarizonae serovar 16:z10:e,n,x,z15]
MINDNPKIAFMYPYPGMENSSPRVFYQLQNGQVDIGVGIAFMSLDPTKDYQCGIEIFSPSEVDVLNTHGGIILFPLSHLSIEPGYGVTFAQIGMTLSTTGRGNHKIVCTLFDQNESEPLDKREAWFCIDLSVEIK